MIEHEGPLGSIAESKSARRFVIGIMLTLLTALIAGVGMFLLATDVLEANRTDAQRRAFSLDRIKHQVALCDQNGFQPVIRNLYNSPEQRLVVYCKIGEGMIYATDLE